MTVDTQKPMKFYVDFENVRGAGLAGVDELDERDHVLIFFSQAAETFHIEQAIDLLNSRAQVQFVEVDTGTTNALDFQLIAALFGSMDPDFDYAIVSEDSGFDAAIKMGARMELPSVVRVANVRCDEAQGKSRSRRGRRGGKSAAKAAEADAQAASNNVEAPAEAEAEAAATTPEPAVDPAPKPAKRTRRRSSKSGKRADAAEAAAAAEPVEPAAEPEPEPAPEPAPEPEPEPVATADPEPAPEKPRAKKRGSRGSGKSGKREDVAALLAANDVELDQQQLSTVMQALNGAKGMQQFYRRFIQLEGRTRGLALYHQVKPHFEQLTDIVR